MTKPQIIDALRDLLSAHNATTQYHAARNAKKPNHDQRARILAHERALMALSALEAAR